MKKTGRNEHKYVKMEQCNQQPCSMKHEINKKKSFMEFTYVYE